MLPSRAQTTVIPDTPNTSLEEGVLSFVVTERELAKDLGWQRPPGANISVALAGRGDPDWSLQPDETKF